MAQNTDNWVSRVEFNSLKDDVKELKKLYDILNRQTVATEKLALEVKYMREDQDNAEQRIKALEERPVKRYDTVVTQLLGNIVAIALGAVAIAMGLKK